MNLIIRQANKKNIPKLAASAFPKVGSGYLAFSLALDMFLMSIIALTHSAITDPYRRKINTRSIAGWLFP